jgi:predicted component of type VI protein secretion system
LKTTIKNKAMFKPGKSGNINGRPKGTPNKATGSIRQKINAFLSDNWEQMEKDFLALDPKDRLMFYEKLMQYGVPKLQSTTLSTNYDLMTEEELNFIIEKLLNHD